MTLHFTLQNFLSQIESKIPDLASSAELVSLGIFSSEAALCKARKSGNTPAFIRFSRGRIRYPRESVIAFLRERIHQELNLSTIKQEKENE
jgi:hypothetical protein